MGKADPVSYRKTPMMPIAYISGEMGAVLVVPVLQLSIFIALFIPFQSVVW